jgi:hypothetical protein
MIAITTSNSTNEKPRERWQVYLEFWGLEIMMTPERWNLASILTFQGVNGNSKIELSQQFVS